MAKDAASVTFTPGSDELVDLHTNVASVRPEDVQVPKVLAKLAGFAVPTILNGVKRKEILPPMLVIKRDNSDTPDLEAIEEDMHCVADLLEYTERRIANDARTNAAAELAEPPAEPMGAIIAYASLYDERQVGFSSIPYEEDGADTGDPEVHVKEQERMVLHMLMGCGESKSGVSVAQRFNPKLFGGGALMGAPVIEAGPDSLLCGD